MAVQEQQEEVDSLEYSESLNQLGELFLALSKYDSAEAYHRKAYQFTFPKRQSKPFLHARTLLGLGEAFAFNGAIVDADSALFKAKQLTKIAYGEQNVSYGAVLNSIASVYLKLNLYDRAEALHEEAEALYDTLFHYSLQFLLEEYSGLTEQEVQDSWKRLGKHYNYFYAFTADFHKKRPHLTGKAMNNILATKAMTINASNRIRQSIMDSKDGSLKQKFSEWERQKALLAKMSKLSISDLQQRNIDLQELEQQVDSIEVYLARKSAIFQRRQKREFVTWEELQKKLSKKEAIIEIIKYQREQNTQYAAYILKYNSPQPELVILPNGSELESSFFRNYRKSIEYKVEDRISYQQYWEPIAQRLKGIKKLYFSPDGTFHQINVNSLKNPNTEDGLLTALEASTLNLRGTELVVLSACETGLGKVEAGEGVFGLQRAFQVAGAKAVMASLWQVDDEATKELMVKFYEEWIVNGKSKRSALSSAQKYVRNHPKHPKCASPYYWAAFILLGSE